MRKWDGTVPTPSKGEARTARQLERMQPVDGLVMLKGDGKKRQAELTFETSPSQAYRTHLM